MPLLVTDCAIRAGLPLIVLNDEVTEESNNWLFQHDDRLLKMAVQSKFALSIGEGVNS